ncbi:MAG: hypothetical protein ACPGU1_13720 [Myxococcota bacterium]
MRAIKNTLVPLSILMLLVPSSTAGAIVIRHDIDPGIYGAQSDHYPSVLTFLWPAEAGVAETASLSATLLSRHWALTAAHGADEFAQGTLRIEVAGVIYEDVAFDRWAPHPCFYSDESPHDLGLVHFPSPPWPALDAYPRLYDQRDEQGKVIVFVGRGAPGTGELGSDGDTPGGPFRNATNTIDFVSESLLGFTFNAPTDEAISPLEGISGDGDSGGPAFMCGELSLDPLGRIACSGGLRLLGVSSFQESSEDSSQIDVYGVTERYVRISSHHAWITQTMATGAAGECTERMMELGSVERSETSSVSAGCQGAPHLPYEALLLWLLVALARARRTVKAHR